MYTIAVRRNFIAQHFLIGGDWGLENEQHSHHYNLEIQLSGSSLDEHGYVVDIVQIESYLDEMVKYYSDHTLNELPEFKDINPSIEHFTRILAQTLKQAMGDANKASVERVRVRLWEHDNAWAAYDMEL
jgi:6-pyruvoyltetrahydropterin/6-carboxytetrahydropterin synthase